MESIKLVIETDISNNIGKTIFNTIDNITGKIIKTFDNPVEAYKEIS